MAFQSINQKTFGHFVHATKCYVQHKLSRGNFFKFLRQT